MPPGLEKPLCDILCSTPIMDVRLTGDSAANPPAPGALDRGDPEVDPRPTNAAATNRDG